MIANTGRAMTANGEDVGSELGGSMEGTEVVDLAR